MRRFALVSTAAVAALGLLALGAPSASAVELPEDNDLFAIDSDEFFSSATNGVLTYISDLPSSGGKYGADYDPTTGKAFYFEDGNPCTLFSLDIVTGVSTEIGPVGGSGDFNECDALDVSHDGTLRIADQEGRVLTVDKATGATISDVLSDIPDISFITQAADGTFYAGSYTAGLFSFDPATGAGTPILSGLNYYETASIDSSGTLWISSDGDNCGQGLWSLDVTDPVGSLLFEGDFLEGVDDCASIFALFVSGPAPAPQLAATGSTPDIGFAPIAVLALLVGVGALALARRQRTA